jgi:hypothetical protein
LKKNEITPTSALQTGLPWEDPANCAVQTVSRKNERQSPAMHLCDVPRTEKNRVAQTPLTFRMCETAVTMSSSMSSMSSMLSWTRV